MAAPKGNAFWKLADKKGRNKKYSPDKFREACLEYFKWCEENPFYQPELLRGGDLAGTIIQVPHPRPYTIQGLCTHLNIDVKTFKNYENDKDFLPIVTHVRELIYDQKFTGASVGAFNSSIIARDLGLKEKTEYSAGGATKIYLFPEQEELTKDAKRK